MWRKLDWVAVGRCSSPHPGIGDPTEGVGKLRAALGAAGGDVRPGAPGMGRPLREVGPHSVIPVVQGHLDEVDFVQR